MKKADQKYGMPFFGRMCYTDREETMAEKDITEKILEDCPDVFADIFNALVFNGRQEIKENELADGAVHSQYRAHDSKMHELERDVAKRWVRGNALLAILGAENQSQPERLMATRAIGYDGASYRAQALRIDAEKRKLKKLRRERKITDAEYAERMKDIGGQIAPVVTIVLYFGTERRWTAPKSLKELLEIPDGLEPFVNDYRLHVFEVAWLSEEQIARMSSDFQVVARFFRDKRLGTDSVSEDKTRIRHVDEVLKLLSAFTGDARYEEIMKSEDYEEVESMCEIMDRAVNKGKVIGREEGREEGRKEGRKEGIKIGARESAEKLFKNGVSYEIVRASIDALSDSELREIEAAALRRRGANRRQAIRLRRVKRQKKVKNLKR